MCNFDYKKGTSKCWIYSNDSTFWEEFGEDYSRLKQDCATFQKNTFFSCVHRSFHEIAIWSSRSIDQKKHIANRDERLIKTLNDSYEWIPPESKRAWLIIFILIAGASIWIDQLSHRFYKQLDSIVIFTALRLYKNSDLHVDIFTSWR